MHRKRHRTMNRPDQVRAVYLELQLVADEVASDVELLRAAANLVELLDTVEQDDQRIVLHPGGVPFEQWSLDRAIEDGGWRVLSTETDIAQALYGDERVAVAERLEMAHWMKEYAA